MNPASSITLTAAIVALGRWSRGQKLDMHLVIAGSFLAISLIVLSQIDDKFGRAMALLLLVAATFGYGPSIVKKAGLTK